MKKTDEQNASTSTILKSVNDSSGSCESYLLPNIQLEVPNVTQEDLSKIILDLEIKSVVEGLSGLVVSSKEKVPYYEYVDVKIKCLDEVTTGEIFCYQKRQPFYQTPFVLLPKGPLEISVQLCTRNFCGKETQKKLFHEEDTSDKLAQYEQLQNLKQVIWTNVLDIFSNLKNYLSIVKNSDSNFYKMISSDFQMGPDTFFAYILSNDFDTQIKNVKDTQNQTANLELTDITNCGPSKTNLKLTEVVYNQETIQNAKIKKQEHAQVALIVSSILIAAFTFTIYQSIETYRIESEIETKWRNSITSIDLKDSTALNSLQTKLKADINSLGLKEGNSLKKRLEGYSNEMLSKLKTNSKTLTIETDFSELKNNIIKKPGSQDFGKLGSGLFKVKVVALVLSSFAFIGAASMALTASEEDSANKKIYDFFLKIEKTLTPLLSEYKKLRDELSFED